MLFLSANWNNCVSYVTEQRFPYIKGYSLLVILPGFMGGWEGGWRPQKFMACKFPRKLSAGSLAFLSSRISGLSTSYFPKLTSGGLAKHYVVWLCSLFPLFDTRLQSKVSLFI